MSLSGKHLVLGVTGSIAAYKAADLIRQLVKTGAEVQPILTPAATRFIAPLTLGTLARREALVGLWPEAGPGADAALWTQHVELGLWADGLVIAPCTAQTLAKLAGGHCDSMLTAVALSARCPVLVAPAMDHDMWHHPATQRNVRTLEADGITVLSPASGELASGLVGDGRMPEPDAIVGALGPWLANAPGETDRPSEASLAGTRVLVTAGPTREAIDPVRFLSNGSTGTMGFEIAREAARRGAEVTLLAGPVSLPTPPGVNRVDITSADDLLQAALAHADADLVIAAAAVSDYAPADASDRKLKKDGDDLTLTLRRTPDVLATLGQQKREGQTLVGFALETHDGEANARGKLERKNLDWVVLNVQGEAGSGFGTGTNRVTLIGRDGQRIDVATAPKPEIARAILDAVA
ncbi:MAG TPA: bifunctional phosphopantothenoylcysteine decarboxylase/phosphopantothenate--cysteine ligase CoaBC [Bacteroidetes bacterium]|nr:bifunctional phosphopantothenoylcysteine decarboxylase/phosphopantothenate--cysteine ligase CoaBC [Bacteroidota bacterium]